MKKLLICLILLAFTGLLLGEMGCDSSTEEIVPVEKSTTTDKEPPQKEEDGQPIEQKTPSTTEKSSPDPTSQLEPLSESEPSLPEGFVGTGNFALAIIGMWENTGFSGSSKIMLIVAIKKLTPSIEDALASSNTRSLGHIEIVDDQGESWKSKTIKYGPHSNATEGWDGPIINMDALPEGFTYVTDLYTEAPGLAMGHIDTITIVPFLGTPQNVSTVTLSLEPVNQIEHIVFGEKQMINKWLSIEAQAVNDNHQSVTRELFIEIHNSSYDKKTYILEGTYQTFDGKIRPNSMNSQAQIQGKSSTIQSLTFESWERQLGQLPKARFYLVSVKTEGEQRFFIIRPN